MKRCVGGKSVDCQNWRRTVSLLASPAGPSSKQANLPPGGTDAASRVGSMMRDVKLQITFGGDAFD